MKKGKGEGERKERSLCRWHVSTLYLSRRIVWSMTV